MKEGEFFSSSVQKDCPTIFCFWEYLRCTLRFSEPSWWSFSETWGPFSLPLRIRLPQTANVKLLRFLLRELPCRLQSQNITHFFGGVWSQLNICLSLSPPGLDTPFFFSHKFLRWPTCWTENQLIALCGLAVARELWLIEISPEL